MPIQVLLKEDIDATGRKGEIVKVKSGFARNYLLPLGKALLADKNALRMQEKLREERAKQAVVEKKDSETLAAKLAEIELEISVKVDQNGHLYGSVTVADLMKALEDTHGIVLGKRDIQLRQPIKKLGNVSINCRLKEDVEAAFKVKVVGDGYVAPAPLPEPVKAPAAEAESTEA